MLKRNKKIIAAAFTIFLAALWVGRVYFVNRAFAEEYDTPVLTYQVGEWIDLGDNYIEKGMSAGGYKLRIADWNLLSYDSFLEDFNISQEIAEGFYFPPDAVIVISVDVYNENNADAVIPLSDLTLYGTDWFTDWNEEIMTFLNDDSWDLWYSCKPGTTDQIYLVYNLRSIRFPAQRWSNLSEESFYIKITYGPEKINACLQ